MKQYVVSNSYEGRKLGKYLMGLFPKMKKSLLEKSLRKKNITVNDKKVRSNYILKENDLIKVFFSDDTIKNFSKEYNEKKVPDLEPIYETEDILVYNKPAGLLTQSDKSGDLSLTDIARVKIGSDNHRVAPLNRLDRNTSGIVVFAKNYKTQRELSDLLQSKGTKKKYLAIVKGEVSKAESLTDDFTKTKDNYVELKGEKKIRLDYKPIISKNGYSLLEIDLKTGKSHQIRAQLAGHGHPIIGDPKYGDPDENKHFKTKYHLDHQLLHAFNYTFSQDDKTLLEVKAKPDKVFTAIESELFNGLLEKTTRT